MTVDTQHDYLAIGQLAAQVRQPVRAIEAAAIRLGITPAMRLNFVPYFDGQQVEQLTQAINKGGK